MGFNHEPSIVKSTPQVQALLMSRKVSFPSIILEICGLEVGHIQWERLGGEILPCIMHSMLVCHDYPWLSFGKQLLYDDFETCWNVCFRRKNNLNIIRHESALQHWIQDRNRTKTLPQKGPRKCEADDGGCGPVEESRKDKWNWRMDSSILRTQQKPTHHVGMSPGHLGTKGATYVHHSSFKHVNTLSLPKWMSKSQ